MNDFYLELRMLIATKLPFLRKYVLSEQESLKIAIENTRFVFWFFGYDINNLSNEQIIESISESAKLFSKAGITSEELSTALKRINA